MWDAVARAFSNYAVLFSDSATLRTAVGFAHVGGLVVGGGTALVEDRAILAAGRKHAGLRHQVRAQRSAHGVVIAGLAVVIVSGLLLFASDVETYVASRTFWIKMGLVVALMINGGVLAVAERRLENAPEIWPRLRLAARLSVALWVLTTLAGAALPNV